MNDKPSRLRSFANYIQSVRHVCSFGMGFTMIELVVVMAIIALLSALAIPSFTKSSVRAKSRDAINNLIVIHAANALYKANVGHYFSAANLAAINSAGGLGLNLVSSGSTAYQCAGTPPTNCVATASGGASVFQVTVTLANSIVSGTNPACTTSTGGCP